MEDRRDRSHQQQEKLTKGGNHAKSFASVVKGAGGLNVEEHQSEEMKTIVMDEMDLIRLDDSARIVLAKVREIDVMQNLYKICLNEGFDDVKIHHVGGTWVWFEFPSSMVCKAFQSNISLKGFLKDMSPINRNFLVDERMVWIEVDGLPLCAWGPNGFKKVASAWGRFMFFEDDQETLVSCGRLCIATKQQSLISESVKVIVEGVEYAVRVRELNAWKIEISSDEETEGEDDDHELSGNDEETEGEDDEHNGSDADKDDEEKVEESKFENLDGENHGHFIDQEDVEKIDESPNDQEHEVVRILEEGEIEGRASDVGSSPDDNHQMNSDNHFAEDNENDLSTPNKEKEDDSIEDGGNSRPQESNRKSWGSSCATGFPRSKSRMKARQDRGIELMRNLEKIIEKGDGMGIEMEGCVSNLENLKRRMGVENGYQ